MFRGALLFCLAVSLAAASDVTGAWELTVHLPGGNDQTVELSFSRANGKLSGTIAKGGESGPLENVVENGSELTFRVTNSDGSPFTFRLKAAADALDGTFEGLGLSGRCTGTRRPQLGDYLAKNSQPLTPSDLQAPLIETAEKEVFLLGEGHGMAVNEELDLGLLRYLHKNAGVRIYIAEWGFAAGRLMNRYLETGDQRVLDFFVRQARQTVSWTKEHREFLVRLREWNQTLPERERVRFVGLDIEHQPQIAAWRLHELASHPGEPAAIRETVSALRELDAERTPDAVMEKLAGDLAGGLQRQRADYSAWLGSDLLEFDVIATNLKKRFEAYADREKRFDEIREAAMYETFLKLQPALAGAKLYGRWGAAHVALRVYQGRDPFAARLNRAGSPVAGKVVSIWPIYRNCESLQMNGGNYRVRRVNDESSVTRRLAEAARSAVTLFKLTGADSPFARALYHFTAGTGGVTTDYAQYLVLIRDAKASHLVEGSAAQGGPRPYVVRTQPAAESREVAPGTIEVRVTFSEAMQPRQFSYVTSMAGQHLPFASEPVLDVDRRTFTVRAKVEPGKVYATWLNTDQAQSFQSTAGEAAVPYLLVFRTRDQ